MTEFVARLREIGRGLHLIETERLFMDGDRSMQRIVNAVHEFSGEIENLIAPESFCSRNKDDQG